MSKPAAAHIRDTRKRSKYRWVVWEVNQTGKQRDSDDWPEEDGKDQPGQEIAAAGHHAEDCIGRNRLVSPVEYAGGAAHRVRVTVTWIVVVGAGDTVKLNVPLNDIVVGCVGAMVEGVSCGVVPSCMGGPGDAYRTSGGPQ